MKPSRHGKGPDTPDFAIFPAGRPANRRPAPPGFPVATGAGSAFNPRMTPAPAPSTTTALPLARRCFLRRLATITATTATGLAAWGPGSATAFAGARRRLHLSTNSYSWSVFYQREGKNFGDDLDAGFADVKASDLDGYEPGVGGPEDLTRLAPHLQRHGLELRSIYVNSALHTEADAEKSLAHILAIARVAKPLGTRIFVTNPNPLQGGGGQSKDDAQLRTQAAALNRLGRELRAQGITLAYHNHDVELRQSAREFHHMMLATDPANVRLCLDVHWVYRGTGNSQVALFDILKLYAPRVVELHLRQSRDGVWSETFGPGDIDYPAVVQALRAAKVRPHLVMEIGAEKGTPKTLSPGEAHRRSVAYAREIFG